MKNSYGYNSSIYLNFKQVEGSRIAAKKGFLKAFGLTTSTTFRLFKSDLRSGASINANAWFGSCKTAEEVKENGLNSTLRVRIMHSDNPKKQLLNKCIECSKAKILMTTVDLRWKREIGPYMD